MQIAIINYGMGNLGSVKNAFDYLSIPAAIVSEPGELSQYDKLILPGVGAFGKAMQNLQDTGMDDAIKEAVIINNKPILGICLGMQLMLSDSTEHGYNKGLDLVPGNVLDFKAYVDDLAVPHVGWNTVTANRSALVHHSEPAGVDFYFVHSFFCRLSDPQFVTGITTHGVAFHSMFEKEHIAGCQFHPEKSQRQGLNIFKNFAEKVYA